MQNCIRRAFAAILVALCALPLTSIAQTPSAPGNQVRAANKIRTFFASLRTATGSSKPDAFHFNAELGQLVVCGGGNPANCSSVALHAEDVVPYKNQSTGGHSLLVIRGQGDYRLCGPSSSQDSFALSCTGVSGAELAGFKAVESATRSAIIRTAGARPNDEYQCGLSPRFGLLCSSAQRLQARDGALLFGSFHGSGTQVVSLSASGNRICEVGGACREALGLDGLLNAGRVAASSRLLESQEKSGIFGLSDSIQTSCFEYMASSSAVAFHCEQASHGGGDDAHFAYSVSSSGHDARDFLAFRSKDGVGRGSVPSGLSSSRSQELKQLTERANLAAGGRPSRRLQMFLSEAEGDWEMVQTATGGLHITPLLFETYGGPDLLQVRDPNESLDIWTDTWGYDNFLDMLRLMVELGPLPRPECIAECDRQKALRDDFCDVLAMDTFLFGEGWTLGATYTASITGPGAVGVLVTGTVTSAGAAAAVSVTCKGVAAAERMRCYARCPSK